MSARTPAPGDNFQLLCPHLTCRKILLVPNDARGQIVKCQHCQNLLKVPGTRVEPKAA